MNKLNTNNKIMKTFLPESKIKDFAEFAATYVSREHIDMISEYKRKYNLDIIHTRQKNVNLFFLMVVAEIDNLPHTHPFRQSLSARGLRWDNRDHSEGTELPLWDTVHKYMEYKGYVSDYERLMQLNTLNIEQWLNDIQSQYAIRITIEELLNAYPNFEQFFKKFGKSHADKQAIKRTEKLFQILEDMYQGEFRTVYAIIPMVHNMVVNGYSQEDIFAEIHNHLCKYE